MSEALAVKPVQPVDLSQPPGDYSQQQQEAWRLGWLRGYVEGRGEATASFCDTLNGLFENIEAIKTGGTVGATAEQGDAT